MGKAYQESEYVAPYLIGTMRDAQTRIFGEMDVRPSATCDRRLRSARGRLPTACASWFAAPRAEHHTDRQFV